MNTALRTTVPNLNYNNISNNNKNSSIGKLSNYWYPINVLPPHRRSNSENSVLPLHLQNATSKIATRTAALTTTAQGSRASNPNLLKSSSYCCNHTKETLLRQEAQAARSVNDMNNILGASNKMQYDMVSTPVGVNGSRVTIANVDDEDASTEYDPFLISAGNEGSSVGTILPTAGIQLNSSGSSINLVGGSSGSNRRTQRKLRGSCCMRAHAFITRNWYLSYLLPLSLLAALIFIAYITRDYAKQLLYWIETQNPWLIFVVYLLLFTLVSFPIVVGYFVLLITAGYLFGCVKGWLTVILGANLGIAIAHATIRSLRHRIPMQRLIKNETGRAILRVISGPRAFKVVLFTRLTPIPFGLQNAIFGISTINTRVYHMATLLGLLPAQTINVYLGSTLRSMHEVLNDNDARLTGYISFIFEVICGVVLMLWVVQKARKELSETLLNDINNDGKHIDIQV